VSGSISCRRPADACANVLRRRGAVPRAVYATWVVEGPRTPTCYNFHNRDVDMRVMVYLSWLFILLNWYAAAALLPRV